MCVMRQCFMQLDARMSKRCQDRGGTCFDDCLRVDLVGKNSTATRPVGFAVRCPSVSHGFGTAWRGG